MTRKRFTKLMMAKGYSRNEANRAADFAVMLNKSYEDALTSDASHFDTERLSEIMQQICDALRRTCDAVVAGITAFCMARITK